MVWDKQLFAFKNLGQRNFKKQCKNSESMNDSRGKHFKMNSGKTYADRIEGIAKVDFNKRKAAALCQRCAWL